MNKDGYLSTHDLVSILTEAGTIFRDVEALAKDSHLTGEDSRYTTLTLLRIADKINGLRRRHGLE